jgi:hypothetical protein
MKTNKKVVTIAVIIIIVLIIAVGAFYYFRKNSKVEGEAQIVVMDLPMETNNLKISLDSVKTKKLQWKDVLLMKGWIFKENGKEKNREVYLVLKSQSGTLVFDIEKDNKERPDVTKYYQLGADNKNHGFEVNIPTSLLEETTYLVGFIVVDETGKYFSFTPKEVTISDGEVTVGMSKEQMAKPKSNQAFIDLKAPTGKTKHGIEILKTEGNNITVGGWGFIQGTNTDNLKSYILLRKDNKVNIYSVQKSIRKDVTNVYKDTKLNFDSSGFFCQILTNNLEKGTYQVGIYMVKGDQAAMIYPNKTIDISK